jgi:hypothetical protein
VPQAPVKSSQPEIPSPSAAQGSRRQSAANLIDKAPFFKKFIFILLVKLQTQ